MRIVMDKIFSVKAASLLLLFLAFCLPASAADDKKAGKEQVRQLQQNQRKLEQEKAQLAQEKTALDVELKESKLKLDDSKRGADAASRQRASLSKELEAANASKAALITKIAEAEQRLNATEKKLADANSIIQKMEIAKTQLDSNLNLRSESLANCESKNQAQHRYGMELLEKYQNKGCTSALLQKEPFTGLKQVQIENMLELYREKLDQQKLVLSSPAP
jgi:chromosome segregation ATPase